MMDVAIIENKIYEIRGQKAMLDFDLAQLYQVETKALNQAVKRNAIRFPEDFMFRLTTIEWNLMWSQFVTTYPKSQIGKESMLKLIQTKKRYTPTSKYKLLDVLIYTVNLEPETIQSYSKMDVESIDKKELASLLKVLPIIDDVTIPDSIFIFHDINSIYLIFQEVALDAAHRHTLKSILKKTVDDASIGITTPKKIKKTKKVVLNELTTKRITHKLNPLLT